jgi:hypothetical protein
MGPTTHDGRKLLGWLAGAHATRRYRMTCMATAAALLLLGLLYYLGFRTRLPAVLTLLQVRPNGPIFHTSSTWLDSVPTFIHAAAFSLLICGICRPAIVVAVAAGTGWAAIDTLYEFACANHQAWFRTAYEHARIRAAVPDCTCDMGDVIAAIAAAAAVTLLAALLLRSRQNVRTEFGRTLT